jgi:Reverse transcriptase (RNA-dependent DNA polymerase)
VYMKQPQGFVEGTDNVCKLKKAIYGLKIAPKRWNETFNEFITKLGFTRSHNDNCLYTKVTAESRMYIILYVDDLIIASSNLGEIEKLRKNFEQLFHMKTFGEVDRFLGIHIEYNREEGVMYLDQQEYIQEILETYGMTEGKPISTPMETNLKIERNTEPEKRTTKPYRELIGSLMYLAGATRPDIMFSVNYLSRFQDSPTEQMWKYLIRILRYLKTTASLRLMYRREASEQGLCGYSDADFGADINDRKSVSGYVFKLHGNTISWGTRKQAVVALSSTESEYIAMTVATTEGLWIQQILQELELPQEKIILFEDNTSAIAFSKNSENTKRLKHIDLKYHFLKDQVNDGNIVLRHVESREQCADLFTKSLPCVSFKLHCVSLNIC